MTAKGTVIVTGGTSGIGLAASRALLREGYEVTLWARDAARGQEVAHQLNGEYLPGKAHFHACDVASAASVQQAVTAFEAHHNSLNILINAAGILRRTPLAQYQPEQISNQIDIVLKGTILTTTALTPHLSRTGRGVVINIGSVAGQHSFIGLGAYGAAKAGVAHFTRTAAQELFSAGVRVLCVCPGIVKTGLVPAREYEALISVTPGRRLQTAEELGQFIVELTRPDYPSLTGAVIDFDDGLSLFLNNRPPAPPVLATAATGTSPALPREQPKTAAPAAASKPHVAPAANVDGVLARVAQVFQQTFGVEASSVNLSTSPEDVARWDSLGNLRLIASLEKEFSCTLDINAIMEMVDVASIVQVMKGKVP
jgi:NAD(P)-dependent dehydrogenase (short-subunit alcohol dehydrogenase family)/acyl carrier protein